MVQLGQNHLITVLIFTNQPLIAKNPLFQIDFAACLFLLIALHSGAFVIILGRKLYWFESGKIVLATILFLIFSGLFTLKQYQAKRPHFHFEVLYRKNIMVGLLLFFFFYVIRSGVNNVYTVESEIERINNDPNLQHLMQKD